MYRTLELSREAEIYTVWHFGSDRGALLISIDCKLVPRELKIFLGDYLEQRSGIF